MGNDLERGLIMIGAAVALAAAGGCEQPKPERCRLHGWSIDCVKVDPTTGETAKFREPLAASVEVEVLEPDGK